MHFKLSKIDTENSNNSHVIPLPSLVHPLLLWLCHVKLRIGFSQYPIESTIAT
jgi:hypothetical protein